MSSPVVVWTNGCFDVLHPGHVMMLNFAKSLGTRLVVGLNSDESIRKLKGPDRPIFTMTQRREVLMSLRCVDQVMVFDDLTPIDVMINYKYRHTHSPQRTLKSGYVVDAVMTDHKISVVVKGSDYANLPMPERDALPRLQYHFYDSGLASSTSKLIR